MQEGIKRYDARIESQTKTDQNYIITLTRINNLI